MTESLLSVFHRNNNTHSPSSSRKHPLIILSAIITVSYPRYTTSMYHLYIFIIYFYCVLVKVVRLHEKCLLIFSSHFFYGYPVLMETSTRKCEWEKIQTYNPIHLNCLRCVVSIISFWWTYKYIPFILEEQINKFITKVMLFITTSEKQVINRCTYEIKRYMPPYTSSSP